MRRVGTSRGVDPGLRSRLRNIVDALRPRNAGAVAESADMSHLKVQRSGRVAEVVMARNALNTLSPDFVDELRACLRGLSEDDSVGALVLASGAEKFFSAGWDLPQLTKLSRADMASFLRAFNSLTVEMATYPGGTVAALSGFAVAGGWILALACDWRVMTTGNRRVGINEVDLGLPIPLPAMLLAREVTGPGARDMILTGKLATPEEALAARWIDALAAPDRVLVQAREIAGSVAAKPPGAVAAMKRELRESFIRQVEIDGPANEEAFLQAFFDPRVRPFVEAAAAKLVPRP
jgi:enoyl-CoA hydratase